MVRIIKGTFIYYDGRFRVPYKAGETLECDPDLERRLVEVDRIAEFVGAEPHSTTAPDEVEEAPEQVEETQDLESMTKAELIAYAEQRGIEVDAKSRKAEIIAAIKAV